MTVRQWNRSVSGRTLVDLTWIEKRIEHRIRFGRIAGTQTVNRHHRVVEFDPGSIFALVRWAANAHGTIVSRIDILRAVHAGEPYQTVPFVHPGGDTLLRMSGWPKVANVLTAIDAIEASGINPAEVAPDHWRHIHNRMAINEPYRAYSRDQHSAWLKRRGVVS